MTVQWLRSHTSTAGGMDSNPGWGTKIQHVTQYSQKKKKNQLTPKSYNLNIYKLPILL